MKVHGHSAERPTTQRFVFTVQVAVEATAAADIRGDDDKRSLATVVADEIASNLESLRYVSSVSVHQKGEER